jgi:hypothetical protein
MTKTEKKQLRESLLKFLNDSEKMWNEKTPHAQIIGFLQGTIKQTIYHLEK